MNNNNEKIRKNIEKGEEIINYYMSDDNFEEKNEIIKRVKSVLEKYNNYKKVIVVTHGMVINALTGISKPECAHFYKYSLNK